jgi:hypothetical protein
MLPKSIVIFNYLFEFKKDFDILGNKSIFNAFFLVINFSLNWVDYFP